MENKSLGFNVRIEMPFFVGFGVMFRILFWMSICSGKDSLFQDHWLFSRILATFNL